MAGFMVRVRVKERIIAVPGHVIGQGSTRREMEENTLEAVGKACHVIWLIK